jgi:CRISPR-associated protein Csd2
MSDHDHSAAYGLMSTRRLIIFKHGTAFGNKPAHELFECVKAERVSQGPACDFTDYKLTLDNIEQKGTKK